MSQSKFPSPPMLFVPEIAKFISFLTDKRAAGVLTRREVSMVMDEAADVSYQAGMPTEDDETVAQINRHCVHIMKKRLLDLHPELREEVESLFGARSR